MNVKVNYPIVGRSSGWCFLKPKNDSPGVLMISGFDFLFAFRDFCSMGFCLGLYKHRGYSSSFGTDEFGERSAAATCCTRKLLNKPSTATFFSVSMVFTGVGKCPMTWVYWTSPYSSHLVDHIPNGWVMFNGDI